MMLCLLGIAGFPEGDYVRNLFDSVSERPS